jgi:oligoribonuclease
MDKLFLFHQMPRLNQYLHYRIVDVTSLKIVVNALNPHLFYKKNNSHRAL